MSDSKQKSATFLERMQYKIDNFFAGGGLRIVLALVPMFVVAFTVAAVMRLVTNLIFPDPVEPSITSINNQFWRVLLQIMDVGSIAEDDNAFYTNKVLAVITAVIGLLLFSTMLAIFSSLFKERLENLRKGKSGVIESGHTLILGFNNRTLEIIRELIEANASEDDAAVVVLAESDKEVMDDFFRYNIKDSQTTRIITRSGATSSHIMLEKLGVRRANSVIILNEAGTDASPAIKSQADYRVLKSILAILSVTDEDSTPPIVANLHFSRNRKLAEGIQQGSIFTIDDDTILAKILVQTSRVSGLALVYSDLVGFKGNEVYFSAIPEHLNHLTFGEILFHFRQSVPLGIRTNGLECRLNPKQDTKLSEGDELIILAEDDSTIKYYDNPPVRPQELAYSSRRLEAFVEKFLIIGWSNKSPIILGEYSSYINGESQIDIVVPKITTEMREVFDANIEKYPHAKVNLIESNFHLPNFPENLHPHTYDSVLILAANGSNAEEIDAETIFLLLKFRNFFREKGKELGQTVNTRLISEVMDSDNIEIIKQTGVRDFLISNQIVSKIMAQLAQEPGVKMVYDDLFSESGSEIYLKPAQVYLDNLPAKVNFADIMKAALKRNEVCFGVRMLSQSTLGDNSSNMYIIPSKDTVFDLQPSDHLITLAEDET